MKWLRRFRHSPDDSNEALAAKIEATVEHKAALDRFAEARDQSIRLERINDRNHFSECLADSFTGKFRERPL